MCRINRKELEHGFRNSTRATLDDRMSIQLVSAFTSYRADQPVQATIFYRGQVADAEPAVNGWRLAVDDLFA